MNFALLAKLGLDNSGFKTSLKESQKASQSFAKSVTSVFGKVAVALGGVALGKNMIRLAMDAEEVASKFNTVLGPAAEGVNQRISQLLKTIPATRAELQNTIATTAQMGKAFGMSAEASTTFSLGMTKIAGDLASFHNMKPEEVFTKLQAAITGEFEPLKRMGIVINEATLKQKALNLGLSDGKSKLDAQTKAITVQNLVLEKMGDALGDAARTQESSANKTKFFNAKLVQLQTDIGQKLLPVFVKFLEIINPLVTVFANNIDAITTFTRRVLTFIVAFKSATFLTAKFSKALILYKSMAKVGATATTILSISLRKLAIAVKGLIASTGIGLLVVALTEVGMMALDAATKTGEGTEDMEAELGGLQDEIEETMSLVKQSTDAFSDFKQGQIEFGDAVEDTQTDLEKQAEASKKAAAEAEAYARKVDQAKRAEENRFIAMKELESLKLKASGDIKAAKALDAQIAKMQEAINISNKYKISLAEAVKLVKKLSDNEEKAGGKEPTDDEKRAKKIEGLEQKIKDMKLAALRAQADGDKKAQESLEKRVELAEKIVSIMDEFNVSQEEATRLANAGMQSEADPESEKRSSLTGHDLRKAANIAGEGKGGDGKDIRFQKMHDGTFQQFIGGKKGKRFSEAEMQKGLQKQIDKEGDTKTLLEKINATLEGKFVSQ